MPYTSVRTGVVVEKDGEYLLCQHPKANPVGWRFGPIHEAEVFEPLKVPYIDNTTIRRITVTYSLA